MPVQKGYIRGENGPGCWVMTPIPNEPNKCVFQWLLDTNLNVAETGIGTYGVDAGAQRYYGHSAAHLSTMEAGRLAAALPAPKKRAVVGATGFTRRHGDSIAARSGVVRRDDLDTCVYN